MKRTIAIAYALMISISLVSAQTGEVQSAEAQIKAELIEQYIIVYDIKSELDEAVDKIIAEVRQHERNLSEEKLNEISKIIRKHSTWESWKPHYVSMLNDTFTLEELKTLLKWSETLTPEIKKLIKKNGELQVKSIQVQKNWQLELLPGIQNDVAVIFNSPE